MREKRKYVLSIAGFDPCGGAGVLADIKTFEANKVYGLGVITGNTFQNDQEFKGVDWIGLEKIIAQIEILKARFPFEYVKIGLVESFEVLKALVEYCHEFSAKMIWDPIMKASAGWEFHKAFDRSLLEEILSKLFMITPNIPEAKYLGGNENEFECAKYMSKFCHVYLKGGHSDDKPGYDHVYMTQGMNFSLKPKINEVAGKHGSGCVLSSALAAQLARGENMHRACLKAKEYTERFLHSTDTLIGYHKL